jgi:hypothetical protein
MIEGLAPWQRGHEPPTVAAWLAPDHDRLVLVGGSALAGATARAEIARAVNQQRIDLQRH